MKIKEDFEEEEVGKLRRWRSELLSRSGGRELLRTSRQDLHSFILTSPRWREVKDSRKESERRSNAELFILY